MQDSTRLIGIKVLDRKTVERGFVMREHYILISIRDPDKRPERYRRSPLFVHGDFAILSPDPSVGSNERGQPRAFIL